MGMQPPLPITVKMDETAHGMEQAPGNGNPKPQAAGKTGAPGLHLVKLIINLRNLGFCHANARIIHIYYKIDPVALPAEVNADIDASFFRKLNGIFQQYLKNMGKLFRIPDKG